MLFRSATLGLELEQLLLEPFARPVAAVLVDPVPVVGIMEDHGVESPAGRIKGGILLEGLGDR